MNCLSKRLYALALILTFLSSFMHIEVLADAIQCLPATIAKSAWGVEFNSDTHTWRIAETD